MSAATDSAGALEAVRSAAAEARREGWSPGGETLREPVAAQLAAALETERARWFYWVPVLIGAGIWIYFLLPSEPQVWLALVPALIALVLRATLPRTTFLDLATAVAVLLAFGFALISLRAAWIAAPVLDRRLDDAVVEGRIERIEPRADRGVRVMLAVSRIDGVAAEQTPRRARIRVAARPEGLLPGDVVSLRARLAPPAMPAMPDDYDFARYAWFQGLGAVGFAHAPPQRLDAAATAPAPVTLRWLAAIERLRQHIGERIATALPGETGAIAAALITGERGGISEATNDVYRDSGLFHILSISGLHMAIMGGAVFWIVRLLLALFPAIALSYPTKKWAALAAIAGSVGYLAISGGSFATVRSFIMLAVMFVAVLLGRPALAMRNVALSALVILLVFPESVLDVGFQMSFAAVVALVAAYEAVRDRLTGEGRREAGMVLRVALFFGGIVMTTLVASIAVAPFAAYHFHTSQQFAVLANLLAVPITNLVVMPAALATLVVMPLGLEAGPLAVMGFGIEAMTWTARLVAALPGAVLKVPAVPDAAFLLVVGGGLWLALWHARWRWLGLVPVLMGLALAPFGTRPAVLVGDGARAVAIRAADGRLVVLAGRSGARYEVSRWLEADGDARSADEALAESARVGMGASMAGPLPAAFAVTRTSAAMPAVETAIAAGSAGIGIGSSRPEARAVSGPVCDMLGCVGVIAGTRIAVSWHAAAVGDDCANADVVVIAGRAPAGCNGPLAVIDNRAVYGLGTHALYLDGPRQVRIETVAGARGARPWAMPQRPPLRRSYGTTAQKSTRPSHEAGRLTDFAAPALAELWRAPRAEDEDSAPPVIDMEP